jgi:hypothetical protein
MAELFTYTGGRLGTHGVTLCKPVGGGVVDIENVSIDKANLYIENGYYQCDIPPGSADNPHSGYCLDQPIDAEHPTGYNCWEAPTPGFVLSAAATPAPVATPQAHIAVPAPKPHTLPRVGAGLDVFLALCIAVAVVALLRARRG